MNFTWIRFLPKFIRKKVEGRKTLQKVITNTGWMFGDRIIRIIIGLLVGIWIARYLGPELFGTFSYALAFAMLFSPMALLGLDSITIRYFVKTPSCRDEVLGTSFILILLGGITVFGLVLGTILMIRPADTLMHWLVGIAAAGAVFQAFSAIEYWFESQYKWRYVFFAKNPAFLGVSLIKIVLILLKAPIMAFFWAGLLEIILGAVGLVIVYRMAGLSLNAWRFKGVTAINLLKDSWPMFISMAMYIIYLRIDQVMLGDMAGSAELGFYSAAVRLTEIWLFIPHTICSSFYPAALEAATINEKLFYSNLQKLYNLMALIAYLIAFPIMFVSGWLVEIIYGAAFGKAGPMLAILIWSLLFTNLGEARNIFLLSKNWTRTYLVCMITGGIVNIGLNYFLIPVYGGMGAVIATCFSYWLAVHGICLVLKPLRKTGWMITKAIIYPKAW